MRQLAILTARELRAHAPVAAVAAAAAALPWVAPWLPGLARHPAPDVRLATAAIVVVLVGGGLALLVGSGLAARDLAEGRLGFFLTLPVRATTVWLSRLLAGCLLVYGAIALVLLPAAGSGRALGIGHDVVLFGLPLPRHGDVVLSALPTVGLLVLPLALLLAAHQLAVALRARTPWIVVELVTFGGGVLLAANAVARLSQGAAWAELSAASGAGLVLGLGAVVAGGAAGFTHGGTLIGRFHRAQALTAGGGILLAALVVALYGAWVLAPGSGDVRRVVAAIDAPAGDWAAALVELDHRPSYSPWVLYNRASGGWLLLSPGWGGGWNASATPVRFTADGRAALWRRPADGPFGTRQELVWIELAGATPRALDTGIEVRDDSLVSLSGDGRLIAVAGREQLAVWTDGGRRLLAAAAVPAAGPASRSEALQVVGGTLRSARVERRDGRSWLQIRELDPHVRKLRVAPPVAVEAPEVQGFSPDGERLLVAGATGVTTLHDARSGALLAEVMPLAPNGGWRRAAFLADGRVAMPVSDGERLAFRLLSRDGALLRELPLGTGRTAIPAGQRRAETVVVSVRSPRGWELREVHLDTGALQTLARGLFPALSGALWSIEPLAAPGARPLLMVDVENRTLVSLDGDGTVSPVLPVPAR